MIGAHGRCTGKQLTSLF